MKYILMYAVTTLLTYFIVRLYLKKENTDADFLMTIIVFCPLINVITAISYFVIISGLFDDCEHTNVWNKIFRL